MRAFISILFIGLVCSGCAVRFVERADGARITEIVPLPDVAPVCSDDDAMAVRQVTVGLWSEKGEGGFGVQSRRYSCLRPECQVIFWVDSEDQLKSLRAYSDELDNICVVR